MSISESPLLFWKEDSFRALKVLLDSLTSASVAFMILAFSFISICTIYTARYGYNCVIYVTLYEVEFHMPSQPPSSTIFNTILLLSNIPLFITNNWKNYCNVAYLQDLEQSCLTFTCLRMIGSSCSKIICYYSKVVKCIIPGFLFW